jgi:hypothetical protein
MNQSGTSRNATWKFVLAVFASAVSVAFAFWPGSFWEAPDPKLWSTRIRAAVLVAWAVGAPLWFMLEYHLFDDKDDKQFARFKYGQSLAAKLWAGASIGLAILYFGKGIFH